MKITYFSGLFSTNSKSSNSSMNMYSTLGDYATIRSGAYRKLLKEYYRKNTSESSSSKEDLYLDRDKNLTEVKESASSLKTSALALTATGAKSLFEEKEITSIDSKTGEKVVEKGYDKKAIYDAISQFVKDYNSTVSSVADASDKSVLRHGVFLTSSTSAYSKSLSKVGINVSTDNKLVIDENKLKEADITDLKSMFQGRNSYAGMVATRASSMEGAANIKNSLYQKNGAYSSFNLSNYNWYI